MASFNGSKFILKQVESILSQLGNNDELIISDDGSTDKTLEIINNLNDNRIKIFNHKYNKKKPKICKSSYFATANFENALLKSTGKYIFLSDQDDIWMPNKVQETISLLKKKPCSLIISNLTVINENDKIIQRNPQIIKLSFIKGLIKCKYHGGAIAFDRDFLKKSLPFPDKIVSHDNWLGLLASFQNRLFVLNKPLLLYRRHGNNVTWDVKNPLWFKIYYRLYYFYSTLKRTYSKN
jgi:glycosyltransferase involved in cell wall biosynthesis